MEASELNTLAEYLIIALSLTLVYSVLIMLGGKNIFKKANQKAITAFYPILNLFTMLEITETSVYLGILFFVPGLNILALSIMLYRLGKIFNTGLIYKLGLVFLPIIFYPLLAFSNKQYKLGDQKLFDGISSMKVVDVNLMTQAELEKLNESVPEEETPKVDSIFKGVVKVQDDVTPYKAVKVDVIGMEKLKTAGNDTNTNIKTEEVKEIPKENNNIEYLDL